MKSSDTRPPHIVILGTQFGFPYGAGATTRAIAYAHGLIRSGARVHVVCARPPELASHQRNFEASGIYEGIPFTYTCPLVQPTSTLPWHMENLKGLLRAFPVLKRLAREQPIDAILLYGPEEPLTVCLLRAMARTLKAKLLLEKCEFPFYGRTDPRARLMMWLNDRYTYRLFDGSIVISRYLEKFITPRLRPDAPPLRIPILVNVDRFPDPRPRPARGGVVAYLGDFGHAGEVPALVEAFSLVAADFPEWRLCLMGGTSNPAIQDGIEADIARLGLEDRVDMPGSIRRDDIPHRLAEADVMTLPRAIGTFSQAGFPTKLGEYLATGKPVVVTATGDIPSYIDDGVNGYLVPPGDIPAFAERLRTVMSRPEEAQEVGRRGRDLATRCFHVTGNGQRILNYVHALRRGGIPLPAAPDSTTVPPEPATSAKGDAHPPRT